MLHRYPPSLGKHGFRYQLSRTSLVIVTLAFAVTKAGAETPSVDAHARERTVLHRLFEACHTRMLLTGKWPANLGEIDSLIGFTLRLQIPTDLEFRDPTAPENAAARRSPLGERTPYLRWPMGQDRWLNVAGTGWLYESGVYWESEFVDLIPRPYADPDLLQQDARPISQRAMPRSDRCGSAQIDLAKSCNAIPTTPWFYGPKEEVMAPKFGSWLPTGIFEHHNLLFDVRGVLQIEGKLAAKGSEERYYHSYPNNLTGIPVGQKCRGFHVLAGTVYRAPADAVVASLKLHFATGGESLPLRYGQHFAAPTDPAGGLDRLYPAPGEVEILYSLHYFYLSNPHPEEPILTLEFCSGMTTSHPFILAITLDL